jgi:FAD dependent oxidoreductase
MSDDLIGRREFLSRTAFAAPLILAATGCRSHLAPTPGVSSAGTRLPDELRADVAIIGGGLGGCAAALAAVRRGLRVILTEETDWIGGQLTQQAVPPDENQWIETVGGTRSYLALRAAIRDYYRRNTPLTERARTNARLNPGNCWVSRIGAEPRVALAVLQEMLAPFVATGQLRVLLQHRARRATVDGDRVRAVHLHDEESGRDRTIVADFFADATELGDLLPMTGTEYVVGAESVAQTGEPHAKAEYQPDNVQGFTMVFAMDYLQGEDHTIDRPRDYVRWRDQLVTADDGNAYPLISFDDPANKRIGFDPEKRTGYWSYRRIIDRDLFTPGTHRSDVTLVNWGLNDYSFGSLCDVSMEAAAAHVAQSKQLSLSLLYWLQSEAPRPDGGTGWKGLRLRPDVLGTTDGFAKHPYIRESRRIKAEFTVLEQHVSADERARITGQVVKDAVAAPFADSVGIGHYSMDLHLTTRGDRGRYGATLPFQIPLGALIPVRMENVLPACKNIGVTHLTNGCYRLHPIEWNVGESVGTLVAFCRQHRATPRAVRNTPTLLQAFQAQLQDDGVPLAWPDNR